MLEGYIKVTGTDIQLAANQTKIDKEPEPYYVPNRVLKLDLFLRPELFGSCLREGIFPTRRKVGQLVRLSNAGKYSGAGKVVKHLLSARLEKTIAAAGDISKSQFGFRKAKSTTDALDI